jgi:hypothetical protein
MSQFECSNGKTFESDENLQHRLESDSQDFYSSKNEFTQSVLRQVDQMSQYIRSFDQSKDQNFRKDSTGGDSVSVSQDILKPLSESLKSNICNAAQETERKGNQKSEDPQSMRFNNTFKHPDLPIRRDLINTPNIKDGDSNTSYGFMSARGKSLPNISEAARERAQSLLFDEW